MLGANTKGVSTRSNVNMDLHVASNSLTKQQKHGYSTLQKRK